MPFYRKILWAVFWVILLAGAVFGPVWAAAPDPQVPPGFRLILSAAGVQLYEKDYAKGNPDFVQRIDLSQGASVQLLHGEVTDNRQGKGLFGGIDAAMRYNSLQAFWNQAARESSNLFCVTNGLFFYMPENPTRLVFPLKVNGEIITEGFGVKDHPGQQLMLELWPDGADINELTQASLYSSSAPDILGGLTEDANKRANRQVGRTFIGLADPNSDGRFEIILVFNTLTALQTSAADVLRSFGAEKVMMLDGGGSTQLICQNQYYIKSDRLIPQALAIFAAPDTSKSVSSLAASALAASTLSTPAPTASPTPGPSLAGTLVSQPEWPILPQSAAYTAQITLENSGAAAWKAGQTKLVAQSSFRGAAKKLALAEDVQPGGKITLGWEVPTGSKPGVYPVRLALQQGSETTADLTPTLQIIVIPDNQAGKRDELQRLVNQWSDQQVDITQQVQNWITSQSQEKAQAPVVNLLNAAMVPLLMLPMVGVLMVVFSKKRRI